MNIKERGIFHTKMVYEQKIATAGKGWSPFFAVMIWSCQSSVKICRELRGNKVSAVCYPKKVGGFLDVTGQWEKI